MNTIINKNKFIKYDNNGNSLMQSDTDKEDITYCETHAQEAVKDALKELYDKGISSVHGNKKGIYEISPDGEKTYVEIYEK